MAGWRGATVRWPETADALARTQERLARATPPAWTPPRARSPGAEHRGAPGSLRVGACAVVFGRGDDDGDAWAAAAVRCGTETVASATWRGRAGAGFEPGLLALREGPLLANVVSLLADTPDVLLVAAAGRDHPRGAGLALQLGATLDLPTVGVTEMPLCATGDAPGPERGSTSPLRLDGAIVAYRVRTRTGVAPVIAHAAWRTSPAVAAAVVLASCAGARWPEALRDARRLARALRDQRLRR